MSDATTPSTEQRVRELETRLALVEQELAARGIRIGEGLRKSPAAVATAAAPSGAPARAKTPRAAPSLDGVLQHAEGWLGRAGIMLLVVGFVLLFRYAVQQGWLTPEMRVFIGLATGMTLLTAGGFFFPGRRLYRQILMGGGIVVLFVTGLAAAELYQLIGTTLALLFFAVVAGTAFTIAAKQETPVIASIGAVGALLPPSFLLTDAAAGPLLWGYLALIILWTGSLLVLRGWEPALQLAAAASVFSLLHEVTGGSNIRLAAAVALAATWFCFAALPLLRGRLGIDHTPLSNRAMLTVPLFVLLALSMVADLLIFDGGDVFAATAMMQALLFAGLALLLRPVRAQQETPQPLRIAMATLRINGYEAAVSLAWIALAAAALTYVESPWPPAALAALAAAALISARSIESDLVRLPAQLAFAGLAVYLVFEIPVISNARAFDDSAVALLLAGVCAAVAAGWAQARERMALLAGVYFLTHVLMATELIAIERWLASFAYGLTGSALLIWGLTRGNRLVQHAGMLSLGLLVVRLFLYDLAQVDVGVRIVLFLVAGSAFLGLSYLVRSGRFSGA